jgi:serine/threonine protein kinase/Tol biopolymer transport system component
LTSAIGTRLGAYRIVSPLGAGGMGEVYRAHDGRLDREVALKVLSSHLADDPEALARFEREAMSVAKLSHPNILSIFEFGHDGNRRFVVTELVDGETLRARLEAGPLPPRKAIAYALQIAKGIAAAHARGIVHRDLKPENVMVTRDDHVKILDFGLAKSLDLGQPDVTRAPSMATSTGLVLGTFGYMAPEQVRGLPVDHRADIFAFGAILYEMLSGERAFRGETAADTMSAILSKDPPDLDARLSISPGVDRIVRRCVEKAPELRFQSANDLAFALETLSTASTTSTVAPVELAGPSSKVRSTWLPWSIAAGAILIAAASWSLRGPAPPGDQPWSGFTRITEAAGEETAPTISPDGSTVAYSTRLGGSWDIYSQRVGGRNAAPIVNDPQRDEGGAAFSPDGSLIAFHESDDLGGIFVAGATGESVRRLTDVGFDPAWAPDGRQLAFGTEEIVDPASRVGDSTLHVVEAAGGSPRRLVDGDGVQPSWSPSGQRIAYWSNTGGQRDIYTVPAGGGTRLAVTQDAAIDWSPVWSPDGRFIYFASDRGGAMNLWRIAVDESSGHTHGRPEPVTAGVQASAALPRFSKDGSRLAFRSRVAAVNPVAIPFDPATGRAGAPFLLDTQNNARIPSDVSRDGKQIAFYNLGDRQEDVFVGSLDGRMRRVTDDAPRDRAPVFSPDGRSLLFYSTRDGNWAVWTIGLDGSNLRKIAGEAAGAVYVHVSPKADAIAFVSTSGRVVYTAPLPPVAGVSPAELPGTRLGAKYFNPTGWSPDGRRLAGILISESGRPAGIATYDFQAKTTTEFNADEAYAVKWLADGRRVVYFAKNGSELVVLDIMTRKRDAVDVRLPAPAVINEMFAVSPDNRTIYYGAARAEADIWIVERKQGGS